MSNKNGEESKIIEFNELIINSEGRAGISFDTLRAKFGFTIILKDSEVYIKGGNKVNSNDTTLSKAQDAERCSATDIFEEDAVFLKKNFGFQDYYQDSIIYSSEKRGIKHYDVIIIEGGTWYNITVKGLYEEYCDVYSTTNVIPKLLKFYFPISYKDLLEKLLGNDNERNNFDGRDTLVRSYEVDSREIIFSKEGQTLN